MTKYRQNSNWVTVCSDCSINAIDNMVLGVHQHVSRRNSRDTGLALFALCQHIKAAHGISVSASKCFCKYCATQPGLAHGLQNVVT